MSIPCPNPLGVPVYRVDPYSAERGGLTTAREIAKAADMPFDAGWWLGPCFIGMPESAEDREVVRILLEDARLAYTEVR